MPSPVPAGYTRGPILFLRASGHAAADAHLLQRFWNEAGAYGSRIAVVAVGSAGVAEAERVAALFRHWESEQVTLIAVSARAVAMEWDGAAQQDAAVALQRATAILLAGEAPLQASALLGGTPLAQLIRRANAQNKAVAATGAGAAILCQHMAAWPEAGAGEASAGAAGAEPAAVQFGPGLGIVNRVLLECTADSEATALPRIASAVGFNPFLVGVALLPASGVVIYPNAALEVFGDGAAMVLDAAQMMEAPEPGALAQAAAAGELAQRGIVVHVLSAGGTFNFDTREALQPSEGDLSLRQSALKAAF